MRVSANRNSEFYDPFNMGSQVWLDGKLITRVVEADDEAGWVIRDCYGEYGESRVLRQILRGRVSIVNPRLLPIPAPRKLTVMVMAGATPSKFTRMFTEHWRAAGQHVEVIEVTPELQGYAPDAIWMDDLESEWSIRQRAMLEETERLFLYGDGNPGRGILDSRAVTAEFKLTGRLPDDYFEPRIAKERWPNAYRVPHDRAWQTKRKKGR